MICVDISIVIPVYNSKRFLDCCLCSVGALGERVEVIVIDDGSNDGTSELCDFYAEKFRNIRVIHKKNEGVGIARNVGIKEANGRWITFVDSDDVVNENDFEKIMELLNCSNIDVLFSSYALIGEDGGEKKRLVYEDKLESGDSVIKQILKYEINTSVWANFYKRSLLQNRFEFTGGLKVGEDFLYNFELFLFNKKLKIEKTSLLSYYYRINETSVMRTMNKRESYTKLNMALIEYEKYAEAKMYRTEIAYHVILTTLIFVKESIMNHTFAGFYKDSELIAIFRKYGEPALPFFNSYDRGLITKLSFDIPVVAEYNIRLKQRFEEVKTKIKSWLKN